MNYDRWAERYDVFYDAAPEGELEFYLNAIDKYGGPVLEIGVGTGRIAIPAAEKGHCITGVDLHLPMLKKARQKLARSSVAESGGSLKLIQADMTTLDLGDRKFATVIMPSNTLALALDGRLQSATIRRATAHMADDGVLAFNVFYPSPDMIFDDSEDEFLLGIVDRPADGLRHVLTGINRFDNRNQINYCTQIIETVSLDDGITKEREELAVEMRYLHHHQVMKMLCSAGLDAVQVYGGFDGSTLSEESEDMVYVCRMIRS